MIQLDIELLESEAGKYSYDVPPTTFTFSASGNGLRFKHYHDCRVERDANSVSSSP